MRRRGRIVGAFVALALSTLAGCAGLTPDPFTVRKSDMAYMVKTDENYRVIPIATEADRDWFEAHLRALFDRRIDRARFIGEGDRRIPGHEPSWRALATLFGS